MAELVILSWRDIPAQVVVKQGRRSAKRELSKRFIEAIDRAARLLAAAERPVIVAMSGVGIAVPGGAAAKRNAVPLGPVMVNRPPFRR